MEVEIGLLLVGHTHEDIDQLFGVFSRKLKTTSVYTMNELENVLRSSNVNVEQVSFVGDFKLWMEPYLFDVTDHSFPHHFLFKKNNNNTNFFSKSLADDPWTAIPGRIIKNEVLLNEIKLVKKHEIANEVFKNLNSLFSEVDATQLQIDEWKEWHKNEIEVDRNNDYDLSQLLDLKEEFQFFQPKQFSSTSTSSTSSTFLPSLPTHIATQMYSITFPIDKSCSTKRLPKINNRMRPAPSPSPKSEPKNLKTRKRVGITKINKINGMEIKNEIKKEMKSELEMNNRFNNEVNLEVRNGLNVLADAIDDLFFDFTKGFKFNENGLLLGSNNSCHFDVAIESLYVCLLNQHHDLFEEEAPTLELMNSLIPLFKADPRVDTVEKCLKLFLLFRHTSKCKKTNKLIREKFRDKLDKVFSDGSASDSKISNPMHWLGIFQDVSFLGITYDVKTTCEIHKFEGTVSKRKTFFEIGNRKQNDIQVIISNFLNTMAIEKSITCHILPAIMTHTTSQELKF